MKKKRLLTSHLITRSFFLRHRTLQVRERRWLWCLSSDWSEILSAYTRGSNARKKLRLSQNMSLAIQRLTVLPVAWRRIPQLLWQGLASFPELLRRPPLVDAASVLSPRSDTASITWQDALWLAVPKKKVTRHKKRLKTTVQKRIKLRQDIVTDPRTGETTLRHKMPFNWKDYLPKVE